METIIISIFVFCIGVVVGVLLEQKFPRKPEEE